MFPVSQKDFLGCENTYIEMNNLHQYKGWIGLVIAFVLFMAFFTYQPALDNSKINFEMLRIQQAEGFEEIKKILKTQFNEMQYLLKPLKGSIDKNGEALSPNPVPPSNAVEFKFLPYGIRAYYSSNTVHEVV